LLQEAGVMPSLTRQMQNEDQQKDPTKKWHSYLKKPLVLQTYILVWKTMHVSTI
jgi:hypothetical protein